ncbi:MAG: DUF5118 domain-containing protein, partial [Planctomycetota bacterium]|nr:DUF5118 domain-containing protein [Planctomycetota bacterium]
MRRSLRLTALAAWAMTSALCAATALADEPRQQPASGTPAADPPAPTPTPPGAPAPSAMRMMMQRGGGGSNKYRDFNEVVDGSEKIEGLFTLHKKDDHLYAEIRPFQFDQPLIAPIMIARGLEMAGNPLNFGDEWVLSFHRAGDR